MEFSNAELEKEISDFFEESNRDFDQIFAELGLDAKRIEADECERFLAERDGLLESFERHLYDSCSILKELDGQTGKLSDQLKERIGQLITEEQAVMAELEELRATKENLREMLDVKSAVVKEGIERKKEIERICNDSVKDEFVRLCKFMNLRFQWDQTEEKFTIGEWRFRVDLRTCVCVLCDNETSPDEVTPGSV